MRPADTKDSPHNQQSNEAQYLREGIVLHLIADYVENLSYLLDALSDEDNDRFDNVLAHADAVQSPNVG